MTMNDLLSVRSNQWITVWTVGTAAGSDQASAGSLDHAKRAA
jgi:hypothetical protein